MEDCLVYEALERVEIFSAPSTEAGFETGKFFVPGDMVSVDFVKKPVSKRQGNTGRYLRLSDGSGWVQLSGPDSPKVNFQPLPVEVGLWSFFVDNFPDGLRPRNHPMAELQWQWQNLLLEQVPKVNLKPMHRVYCDRRVVSREGVNYYRLQQGQHQTPAWVYDKRRKLDTDKQHTLMMSESQVQFGVFAFRAIKSLKLRMYPLANKRNLTGFAVAPNDVFVVDIIRGDKYYRMSDGSGWIFVTAQELQPIPFKAGTWAFRVMSPYGVKLQTQPDDDRTGFGDVIKHGELVLCDGKLGISVGYGRSFYHVQGTNGWVSDMGRDRRVVMERVSADQAQVAANGVGDNGWTEGFVRGVSIASMAGVTEISHHPESNILSFHHPRGPNLQVFYATRTVGITEVGGGGQPVFCRNCSNEELVEIFKNPSAFTNMHTKKEDVKEEDEEPQEDPESLRREEVEVRNQLLALHSEFLILQSKKDATWKKLMDHQEKREIKEAKAYELWQTHMKQRLEEEEKLKREEGTKEASVAAEKEKLSEKCYVYRVVHDIGVRSAPNVDAQYRTDRSYCRGDLISIDSILDFVSHNRCGPYLRLSDGSGWLFARDQQGTVMEEVEVEVGAWNFYVGNEPTGIGLRNHPMDHRQDGNNGLLFPEETTLNFLKPFQRVSCDRKVVGKNGVNFYRVAGSPRTAWISDKRFTASIAKILLHPASQVRTGLFAFEALDEIAIRKRASVSKKHQTKLGVSPNDIVVADLIFESDYNNRDGPFIRLVGGSGWLFVNIDGDKVMKDIPIKTGKWRFRITNPNGQSLLKQPIDKLASQKAADADFKENQIVICDREIKGANGMSWFYRPVGRDGWLPNFRGKMKYMVEEPLDGADDESTSWSVDLVRGVGLAIDGITEIGHNATLYFLTFQSSQGATINVNYSTCSVETVIGDPSLGKNRFRSSCTREELVEIFNETVDDGCRRPVKRRRKDSALVEVNVEDEYRNRLLELDLEEAEIKQQREALWKAIREREKKPEDAAVAPMVSPHTTDGLICPTCYKVFASLYAKQMHQETLGH